MAGRAVRVGPAEFPELLLHVDAPTSGIAHLFAMTMGGQTCVSVRAFLYGRDAAEVASREQPRWQQWMAELTQSHSNA